MNELRIAFFGLPLAGWLLHQDGHRIVIGVLPPIEGPGRRRLRAALDGSVPLVDLLSLGDSPVPSPNLRALLQRVRPDLIVSWFWTRRFLREELDQAPLGAIGVHPSLLPLHRGPNPYFAAIDAGDTWTGVTVHRLTEAYDEGAILAQEKLLVGASNSWQLARRLDRPSLRQLRRVVRKIASGADLEACPQDESLATWAPEPTGDLLRVDWSWPTVRVLRRLRALSPVPGLPLEFAGTRFYVVAGDAAPSYPAALLPGEGAVVGDPPQLVIRTGDGAIRVLGLQLTGDNAPTTEDTLEAPLLTGPSLTEWVAKR